MGIYANTNGTLTPLAGGGSGSGAEAYSLLEITFDAAFSGLTYTLYADSVVQEEYEIYTRTVPASLKDVVRVKQCNMRYVAECTVDSKQYTNSITTADYFGEYKMHLYQYHIYGVRWASNPSTVMERTDDAAEFTDPVPYVAGSENYGSPFDNLYPWSEMTRVQYNNSTSLEMVKIPRFWYKLEGYGDGGLSIKIADAPVEGYMVCPACRKHYTFDDSDFERSYVLVGRYQTDYYSGVHSRNGGSWDYLNSGFSNYESYGDVKTYYDIIHMSRGKNFWSMNFDTWFSIHLLYLVEFANWNVDTSIGTPPSKVGNGGTDSMPYHTGTMASDRATAGAWQYRYIENLRNGYLATWLPGISYRTIKGAPSIIIYDRLDTVHDDMVNNNYDSPWIRIIPPKSGISPSYMGSMSKVVICENSLFAFMAGNAGKYTNWQNTYTCGPVYGIAEFTFTAVDPYSENTLSVSAGFGFGTVGTQASASSGLPNIDAYSKGYKGNSRILIRPEEARPND